ncbi:hypothetical protein SD71_18465 [Cohnella kolymensis]|uniref:DUF1540 domain-containing protein n=1 Tax=Cohnella kolymensis TaxID=1590652 RepID=A0ABR5A1X8_9BACL|nr:DUF1540 domain-containing protein [Cohnella kolymensis]KIL34623.1 hypothetical protein SD71_18465 [Cohnella kolymensis]
MPKGVVCSISNCTFWDQGNRCGADQIAIEIDQHAQSHWNEEFAEEFFSHQDSAGTSSVTCCQTFQPKSR